MRSPGRARSSGQPPFDISAVPAIKMLHASARNPALRLSIEMDITSIDPPVRGGALELRLAPGRALR